MKPTVSLKYLLTDCRLIDSAISKRQGYQRKHSFLEKKINSIIGKRDSLWTPRNIKSLDDHAIKQSTHQFHEKILHLSRCLACSAEKKEELKTKKQWTELTLQIYIQIYVSNIYHYLSPLICRQGQPFDWKLGAVEKIMHHGFSFLSPQLHRGFNESWKSYFNLW